MSDWSIEATGTAEGLRETCRAHEERYWRLMPSGERGMAVGTVGHLVNFAEEQGPADTWSLSASGAQEPAGGVARIHAQIKRTGRAVP